MQVRTFGSIRVARPGQPAEAVSGRRPSLILTLLASRHGQVVGDDAIADAVWGERPPASARTAIQTYISALRDQLEPGRPRHSAGRFILHEQGGYRLATDELEVDLAQFESLIDEAADQHRQDRSAAIVRLDRALELWSDPPLGEFADDPWAVSTVARLRERHAAAIEARVGLALDDDRGDEVLDLLVDAVETYPYRERLAGQLMLLHYRRGAQERALDTFTAIRRRLVEDLGLEPGRELQLLQRAILDQDPSLLRRSEQPADLAPSGFDPTADDGLPPSRRLVGRADDLRAIEELLTSAGSVTITGPGGAGKSALAVNLARDLQRRFGLRIQYIDLVRHPERSVWRALASELRVVEHPLVPLDATIADALAESPTLMLVETCELAPEEVSEVVSRLAVVPGLRIVLTSQVPVGAHGECVHRLAGVSPDAAVELLARATGREDEVDPEVLARIAERLGRLPLGLELAAARLTSLGAVELLRQLDKNPDLLTGGSGRPDRQRSVRAAAEWSVGLLDPSGCRVLARLTSFSAPFTLAMAEAVFVTDEHVAGTPFAAVVGDLVDRSLLERRGGDRGAPRFRLPDDVSAAVCTVDPEGCATGRRQLAEYVLGLAQAELAHRNGRHLTDDPADLARRLDGFGSEVLPAIRYFDGQGDARALLLAGLLGSYFQAHGLVSEGREILIRAGERYADAPPIMVVAAAGQAGFLAWYQGDGKEAVRLLDAIVPRLDDVPLPGFAETVLGSRSFGVHDYASAADHLDVATEKAGGSSRQRLLVDHLAGNANWYAGRLDRALEHYRHQRDVAAEVGDDFNVAQALRFEAMLLAYRARLGADEGGDAIVDAAVERAWRLVEQSRAMSERLADPLSVAQSAASLALLGVTVGDSVAAARDAVQAVRSSRRQFDVFALRTVLPVLALRSLEAGDPEAAAATLGWYADLLERCDHRHSMAAADLAEQAISQCREQLGRVEYMRAAAAGAARSIAELADDVAAVG